MEQQALFQQLAVDEAAGMNITSYHYLSMNVLGDALKSHRVGFDAHHRLLHAQSGKQVRLYGQKSVLV